MSVILDSVSEFVGREHGLYIAGEERPSSSGARLEVVNPATGKLLATVAAAGASDIDDAVAAARAALPAWAALAPAARAELLWNLGARIAELGDEFAQLEALDNGKTLAESNMVDIPLCAGLFKYYAGWATKLEGSAITPAGGANFHVYTRREPVGVVGAIIPWNFPLLMCGYKLGPALAAGNTVVLKPAEQTPLTALRLAELIAEVGFPPGVVNIVPGLGPDAGAPLAAHPGVDKITFTGENATGQKILEASKGNMKKLSLELGGKSPSLVFDDADLDAAVEGTYGAVFFNQGQCCIAGARVYVQDAVYDEFVARIVAKAEAVSLGSGLDPASTMGPLVSLEQQQRVLGLIQSGVEQGARLAAGTGFGAGPRRLLRAADRVHRCPGRHAHHARGDLRAGRDGQPVQRPRSRHSRWRTTRRSGSRPGSGPATCSAPTGSRRASTPASCGSTRTAGSTRQSRTAASA